MITLYCNGIYLEGEKIKKSFQATLRRRIKAINDSDLLKDGYGESFTEKEIKLIKETVKNYYDKRLSKLFQ